MKILFSILFSLIFKLTYSQKLTVEELLPPESNEVTDLAFLSKELQGKQVVMLGEQTHVYGNIFEMKARVVEYLHKELGFTTFAMESPMYEIWKMNQKRFTKEGFNDAVFSVWSQTSEFQRLVNYLDKNKLKVIGFDSQLNDADTFIDDFFAYCDKQKVMINLNRDDLGIIIEAVSDVQDFDEDDIKFKTFEKEINRIIKQIEKLEDNEDNYYWKQFTKSLLASSQDAFHVKKYIISNVNGDKDFNVRDKQMADNLLSYIKRHPKDKIICWADNLHVISDNSSVKEPIAKEFIPMGSYIKKELKDKVYSLGTIHANDSLLYTKQNIWHPTPVELNSFEHELKQFNIPYLFVSSNQKAMRMPKFTRLLSFVDFMEMRVDQLHDGYIFFGNATIPKLEYEKVLLSKNIIDSEKKITRIDREKSKDFKSQIVNEQTNEAIPFATIIFKKENIYRIADEGGNFKYPSKTVFSKENAMEISALGYETKTISLSSLNEKIYLKAQFELVPEVVIEQPMKPKAVLKKAILNIKKNHPDAPFNFDRYSKILINKNDQPEIDLELMTKEYSQGYLSQFLTSQRVEQVKWNSVTGASKTASDFFGYRENPIQYATILNKRKYKKFELSYVYSDEKGSADCYIIEFKTERNKWSYTNKIYPTKYSGRIYINKVNFAIIKVVENWETALNKEEINNYLRDETLIDCHNLTIKQENVAEFSQINQDGKYYATSFFKRSMREKLSDESRLENNMAEIRSYTSNFITENIEEIKYENHEPQNTKLNRITYDANFWNSFYDSDFFSRTKLKKN